MSKISKIVINDPVTSSSMQYELPGGLENIIDGPEGKHSIIEGAVSTGTYTDPESGQTVEYAPNVASGLFSHAEGVSYPEPPADNPHDLGWLDIVIDQSVPMGMYFILTDDITPSRNKIPPNPPLYAYLYPMLIVDSPSGDPSQQNFLETTIIDNKTAYIPSSDTEVISGKTYYEMDNSHGNPTIQTANFGGADNPHELGWMEVIQNDPNYPHGYMTVTDDTKPDPNKIPPTSENAYYYPVIEIKEPSGDPSSQWYLESTIYNNKTIYYPTSDTEVISGKTYYEMDDSHGNPTIQTANFGNATISTASGFGSHAEGIGTIASGEGAHAEGISLKAETPDNPHELGWLDDNSWEEDSSTGKWYVYLSTDTVANSEHSYGRLTLVHLDSGDDPSADSYLEVKDSDSYIETSDTTVVEGKNYYIYDSISSEDINYGSEKADCIASGKGAHAEGITTSALGDGSHTEGYITEASEQYSHAEGYCTTASGVYGSHAEGDNTIASGFSSHAQNRGTIAQGRDQTVIGKYNIAQGNNYNINNTDYAFIIGNGSSYNDRSNALGIKWNGNFVFADGHESTPSEIYSGGGSSLQYTIDGSATGSTIQNDVNFSKATSSWAHAEGQSTTANGVSSHAEGSSSLANGDYSHAEGNTTLANGNDSHAEGGGTKASGADSHAEGDRTTASNVASHAEGGSTIASGDCAHSEGWETTASGGWGSHTEGRQTLTSGNCSHAEGYETTASGGNSHAEGWETLAGGSNSHAEGLGTIARGYDSHAQNEYTIAQGKDQTVIGKYNVAQGTYNSISNTDYAFIIGNGTSSARSNALAIRWDGNFVFANDVIMTPPVVLTQTLAAGSTTVTFTNAAITSGKMYDVYTTVPGLNYTAIDDSTSGSLVITYEAQSSAITIKLVIREFS